MDMVQQVEEATAAVRAQSSVKIDVGLILGSGLGAVAEAVHGAIRLPYEKIPHFPVSTVAGHAGELVVGSLCHHQVAVMRGRIHYYEGYTMQQVTFPVRLMRALGARLLIVTNSCGGIHPKFVPGDMMLITDHLNLMGTNPLIGPNDERLGPRFPPMARAYDQTLRDLAHEVAVELGLALQEGVYAGLTGPAFETPAEIRFLERSGADAVGMSTVPEVLVANHAGMRVMGLSCVTNVLHQGPSTDTHHEVLDVAGKTSPKMLQLLLGILEKWEVGVTS